MVNVADLLERNKAISHTPIPYISELPTSGLAPIRTLIITCCDPRCIPEKFLNLDVGEAVVHRNAGGNIRHALRDVLIIDSLFTLEEVMIVHHTDCGTLQFTNEGLNGALKARVDKQHWVDIDNIDLGANTDMTQSIKDDLEWAEANPLIRKELKKGFQGYLFDIKTGTVTRVNQD